MGNSTLGSGAKVCPTDTESGSILKAFSMKDFLTRGNEWGLPGISVTAGSMRGTTKMIEERVSRHSKSEMVSSTAVSTEMGI